MNKSFRKNVTHAMPEMMKYNDYMVTTPNLGEHMNNRLEALGYGDAPGQLHVRKNAVLAFELVFDFSPDMAGNIDIKQWKRDCLDWTRKHFDPNPEKYGSNILGFAYHGDEEGNANPKNPENSRGHIHAIIQPITEYGRLCASQFLGDREQMAKLHTLFWREVGKKHGLTRAIKGSPIRHQEQREYRYRRDNYISQNRIAPVAGESVELYSRRVEKHYDALVREMYGEIDKSKKEVERQQTLAKQEKQLARELQDTLARREAELDEAERLLLEERNFAEKWRAYEKGLTLLMDDTAKSELIQDVLTVIDAGEKELNKEKQPEHLFGMDEPDRENSNQQSKYA